MVLFQARELDIGLALVYLMSMLTRTRSVVLSAGCGMGLFIASAASCAWTQATLPAITLEGVVDDPSGARVVHANIHVQRDHTGIRGRESKDITSDGTGHFALALAGGTYELFVQSRGFETFHAKVTVGSSGTATWVTVPLAIKVLTEEIMVDADRAASNSAADNKSALIFAGKDLNMFSGDDANFQKQILALTEGGGSHAQIYVNGFSNGRFPPKSSIREVRLNRNPYSALYDSLGLRRLEISTKPGTDQLHGSFQSTGNDISFNASNPYTGPQPSYFSYTLDASLTGSIDKKTSFFLGATYNDQQNNAAVNAVTLNADSRQESFLQALPNPLTNSTYSLRLDHQVTPNNTVMARYEFNRVEQKNGGVGLLVLPSEGFNSGVTNNTLQISDTQVIGSKMIAETRFQYIRQRTAQDPASGATSLIAEGSFNGGGNPAQQFYDHNDDYEFQHIFMRQQGTHVLHIGGRYRLYREANYSRAGYNGEYLFPSLAAYELTQTNVQNCAAGSAQCLTPAQLTAAGGGASQYSLTTGQPNASVLTGDLGVFVEDEWKINRDVSVDLGFRFESQSAVPDHVDPAPRGAVAWSVRRKAKPVLFVLRAGGGLFYDRFLAANLLTATRENGVTQQTFVVDNPDFYPALIIPDVQPSTYTVSPKLRTEYGMIGGVSVEKVLGKLGRISANYTVTRGDHQYVSRNINAPLPGTYDPGVPGSGTRPLGGTQNLYEFDSDGLENSQVFFVNSRVNPTKRVVAYLSYSVLRVNADASNANTFASNSYNLHQDYGRYAEPSQTLYTGGTVQLPFGLSSNVYFSAQKGTPFNITTGTDLNGDSIYNDRPTFATDLTRASVVKTRFGNFDTQPVSGQRVIPINYGNAPNFVFVDLSMSRNFAFGPRPAAEGAKAGAKAAPRGDPPFSVNLSVDAQNVFNHVNPGTPVGVLGSPLFGKSNSLNNNLSTNTSANRLIQVGMTFTF